MRIGVVSRSDIDIFSPKQGAAVKLYYTMISLASLGHEVFFLSENNDKYWKIEEEQISEINYPLLLSRLFNKMDIFKSIVTWLGVPEEEWVLYHPVFNINLWFRTLYVSIKENLDLLQAEFPAFAFPALFTKLFTMKRVSLVEHNVESLRIQHYYENLSSLGSYFLTSVERLSAKFSDHVITVSPEDKKRLENLGIENVKVIPHGVDKERYKDAEGSWVREKYDIEEEDELLIFHGVLCYQPNEEAANLLAEEIFPQVLEDNENRKLLIVGGHPPQIERENVITTGFVDKLEDYLEAADLAVVPLQHGGGTRLKILEYFASDTPVISTKKGVEGLKVEDKNHLIISDVEEFSSKINKLLRSEEMRKNLIKKGKKYLNDLDWKNIAERYQEIYEN